MILYIPRRKQINVSLVADSSGSSLRYDMRIALAFFVMLLGFAGQAFAHATPITYEPASSSVIEKTPERVRIHFSERIEPTASDITVLGPDGTQERTGGVSVDAKDSHFFMVGLRDAGVGTYTVTWQVVSADDGHFTKGAFIFSVGKQTAASAASAGGAGQIQIQHITTIPQATVMWLELMGHALLAGMLLVVIGIWRPLAIRSGDTISFDEMVAIGRRTKGLVIAGVACVLAGVISLLVLKTFDLEQLRITAFVPTLRIFIQTLDGMHAVMRGALALLFGMIFFSVGDKPAGTKRISGKDAALIAIMAAMVLSRARVSHSAATAFFPAISIGITALHLLSKELWVGGVAALMVILLPLVRRKNKLLSLISFSAITSIIFGVTGVTGIYIIWLDLKNPAFLFASEWGARFVILLIFAALLTAVRMVSQLVVEKRAVDALSEDLPKNRNILRWSYYLIPFEMLTGAALLFVTSFLIITTPPYPPTQFLFEKHATNEGAMTSFAVDPYEPDQFLVTVDDNAHTISDVIVRLTNEEKGIGPLVAQGQQRFPGGFVISRNTFSLPGRWRVNIIVHRSNIFDATASFMINYPSDIDTTRVDPEHRSFGLFEILLIMGALIIAGITLWLYGFSMRLRKKLELTGADVGASSQAPLPTLGKSIFICMGGLAAVSFLIFIASGAIIKTDFQKQCERDGNFWLQAVPMRDGAALSSDTVTGCTLNVGLYHFPDQREYAFFTRLRQSMAEITTIPAKPIAGMPTLMSVELSAVEQGKKAGPIQDIGIYHDRIVHVIIVGEDLKTFAHIHAEDRGPITDEMRKTGIFPLRHVFPKAGRYAIVVNYVQGGKELSQQSFVNVGGSPAMEKNAQVSADLVNDYASVKNVDGYHVTFQVPDHVTAGAMTKLTYVVEKDGNQVTDLEPYLGAAMHLAIVRGDMSGRIIHSHGQPYLPGSAFFQQLFQNYVNYHSHFVPDHFGPKIQARIAFPQPGLYEVFGEFKDKGRVVTSLFTVRVE